MREFLLGGSLVGQNTLIRFYVLHVVFLPLALFAVAVWHMWRIRKDGGLARPEEAVAPRPPVPARPGWNLPGGGTEAGARTWGLMALYVARKIPRGDFLF